jgi:nitroimidazol reductase NimA-like FMN-containing flavoprotein (pyridoxamine 5'-phosphate oxidase superfamily)
MDVGRVAVMSDEFPVVLPVNYRLVETDRLPWVALRSRPGNVVDQAGSAVAFEVDQFDEVKRRGWSVLVQGMLHHVNRRGFRTRFDSHPWLEEGRDAWLVIEPVGVTGRVLHGAEPAWSFHPDSYL